MLREFRESDIDKIMQIWRDGNFKAHNFIPNKYWSDNYVRVQNEYLKKSNTWVYTENEEIQAFISIMDDGYIGALFVVPEIQRDGIGTMLVNHCKNMYERLYLNVYEKNVGATMFYKAMGFKKIKVQIDEATQEKEYIMEWGKSNKEKVSIVYFDNSYQEELVKKYLNDEILDLNCIQVYSKNQVEGINNIDIRPLLVKTPSGMRVKDHIALIAAFSKAFRNKRAVLYINNANDYDMLEMLLKDFIKVKKISLLVVLQKPFLIEGNKKIKQSEILEQKYKMFPIYKCNYDQKGEKLSFKDAFYKRDEECLKEIKEICKNFNDFKNNDDSWNVG